MLPGQRRASPASKITSWSLIETPSNANPKRNFDGIYSIGRRPQRTTKFSPERVPSGTHTVGELMSLDG
jgi:hypothetical protein